MKKLLTIKEWKERMEELEWCAIAQGFGKDLKPLYKYPVMDIILYLRLWNILKKQEQKKQGRSIP